MGIFDRFAFILVHCLLRCCHIMTPRTSSLASGKILEKTQKGNFPLAMRHARLIQQKEQIIRFFSTLEGNHHFKTDVVQHQEKDCRRRQGLEPTSFCSDSNWFQSLEFERKFDGWIFDNILHMSSPTKNKQKDQVIYLTLEGPPSFFWPQKSETQCFSIRRGFVPIVYP